MIRTLIGGAGSFVVTIAVYVVMALAMQTIAKRQKHEHPWFAWVPFLNVVQIFQLGEFAWPLIFLMFVPVLGWIALYIISIIAFYRIFEKESYDGVLAVVSCIISPMLLIMLAVIAWKKK